MKSFEYTNGLMLLGDKSHQALNLKMKWNLLSCVLPDYGSLVMYLIRTVIDHLTICFSNRMIGE